jgi:hypothetical protein
VPDFNESDIDRILQLRSEGKLSGEIARQMSGDEPSADLLDSQRRLQDERAKLRTGATAPGEEPGVHPFDAAAHAARLQRERGGNHGRQMGAYLQTVTEAALAGDSRVTSSSHDEAKAKWLRRQGIG